MWCWKQVVACKFVPACKPATACKFNFSSGTCSSFVRLLKSWEKPDFLHAPWIAQECFLKNCTHPPQKKSVPQHQGLEPGFPTYQTHAGPLLFGSNYSPLLSSQQLQLRYKDLISEFFPAWETRRHKENQEPKLLGAVVCTVPCFALSLPPALSIKQKKKTLF